MMASADRGMGDFWKPGAELTVNQVACLVDVLLTLVE